MKREHDSMPVMRVMDPGTGATMRGPHAELVAAARAAEVIRGNWRMVVVYLSTLYSRYRDHRSAVKTYEALRHLDDHSLHDLGFDRSELGSVAAEASGLAPLDRLRTLHDRFGQLP